ncbi:hypothetical protein CR513_17939, partial [Mucuna pruriens]
MSAYHEIQSHSHKSSTYMGYVGGYEIPMKENCLCLKDQNSNLVPKVFMSRNRIFTLSIKTNEHARRSFPKEVESKANESLQLVNIDVSGPIDPPSFGKNKYFLLFIDDFSWKTWVYFLKHKSKAFVT